MSKSVYMAGTMTDRKDRGRSWRVRLGNWLEERGEEVFSPPDRELELFTKYDIPPSVLYQNSNKVSPSVKGELLGDILDFDLDQIEYHTKYCIFFINEISWGTAGELTYALRLRIPVYIVTKMQLKSFAAARPKGSKVRIFQSFDQLKTFLKYTYGLRVKK